MSVKRVNSQQEVKVNLVERKRLVKLTEFLDKLQQGRAKVKGKVLNPERFRMNVWRDVGPGVRTPCGTAACAVGHIPEAIPRSGMKFEPVYKSTDDLTVEYQPVFEGQYGWDAVQRFFGLSVTDTSRLFDSSMYVDSRLPAVVERISSN